MQLKKKHKKIILMIIFQLSLCIIHSIPIKCVKAQPELTVDVTYIAKERADIVVPTYIGYHVIWTSSRAPLMGGKVIIKDIPGQ